MADGTTSNFIRKRDGRIVPFTAEKITGAIYKAAQAVGGSDRTTAQAISDSIIGILNIIYKDGRIPTVENVQDLVEKMLIERGHAKVAKAYILYREQHRKIREGKSLLTEGLELIESYLDRSDWRVNENSNMSYSLQGLNNHIATAITAKYWLERIYPPEIRNAHVNCDFHIHDLGLLSAYCVGWDLRDLLLRGIRRRRRQGGEQAGQAFPERPGPGGEFLLHPAGRIRRRPGLRQLRHLSRALHLVRQALLRRGEAVPPGIHLQHEHPHPRRVPDALHQRDPGPHGAVQHRRTSTSSSAARSGTRPTASSRTRWTCSTWPSPRPCREGDAKNRIFTFPIPTYNITKDFDWDNAKLDPMWEMTAKYGIPYFANFVNSDMDPEDARSMCCRLRLDNRELRKRGGGLFGANPLTGSIGVVTINLPRIAYLSKNEEEFFDRLERLMVLAKNSLEIKRKALENFTENNLYPYTKHYLSAIYRAEQEILDQPFLHHRPHRHERDLPEHAERGHRHHRGQGVRHEGPRLHAGAHHGVPGGDRQLLQPRGDPGRGRELPLRHA